jgi:hypothetical protein
MEKIRLFKGISYEGSHAFYYGTIPESKGTPLDVYPAAEVDAEIERLKGYINDRMSASKKLVKIISDLDAQLKSAQAELSKHKAAVEAAKRVVVHWALLPPHIQEVVYRPEKHQDMKALDAALKALRELNGPDCAGGKGE